MHTFINCPHEMQRKAVKEKIDDLVDFYKEEQNMIRLE